MPLREIMSAAGEAAADTAVEKLGKNALDGKIELPDDSGEREYSLDLPDDSGQRMPDGLGKDNQENKKSDLFEKEMEPPAECTFKCPDGSDKTEFHTQVKDQQDGLNQMSIGTFLRNRENYKQNGRDTKEGAEAQQRARQEARADKIVEFRNQGMSRKQAEKKADEWLSSKAALHNPDQVAGGDPQNVTGMGDSTINSSIGAQWGAGKQADKLEQQVRDYIKHNNISPNDLDKIKMNVRLNVV